jgi:hypothetical protein
MTRLVHPGSFLLVEGDDDFKFWSSHRATSCELIIASGKPNLLGAIERLDRRQFAGALGVVDADFDRLVDSPYLSDNIVCTDGHDLEGLLLRSHALEKTLAELGQPNKLHRFEENGTSVRQALLDRGLIFGRLRWLNQYKNIGLDFTDFRPDRFVDRATWRVDEDRLFQVAADKMGVTVAKLKVSLAELEVLDPWQACQGHDLVVLLTLGLRKVLGSLKKNHGTDYVAAMLRTGFEHIWLTDTRLHKSMIAWEGRNPPFRVL